MAGEVLVGLFTLSGTAIGIIGTVATEQLRARHALRAQRVDHAHDTRGSIRSDLVSAIAEFIERDYGAARTAALAWSAATTTRLRLEGEVRVDVESSLAPQGPRTDQALNSRFLDASDRELAGFQALGDAVERCAVASRRIELVAPPAIGELVRRVAAAVSELERRAQPDEWGEGWSAALPRNAVDEIDVLTDQLVVQVREWIHQTGDH